MNDVDILVTAPLPPFLYDPLQGGLPLRTTTQARATSAALLARAGRAQSAASCRAAARSTPTTLLDALPKLEIISVFGVGYDGVPVDYCSSAASRSPTRRTC